MIEKINDVLEGESNCCGAKMYQDICSDCKEHCMSIEEEDKLDYQRSLDMRDLLAYE